MRAADQADQVNNGWLFTLDLHFASTMLGAAAETQRSPQAHFPAWLISLCYAPASLQARARGMLVCTDWLRALADGFADEFRQLQLVHRDGFQPKRTAARLRDDPRFVEAALWAERNSSCGLVRAKAAKRPVPREAREREREEEFGRWVEYSLERFIESEHQVAPPRVRAPAV